MKKRKCGYFPELKALNGIKGDNRSKNTNLKECKNHHEQSEFNKYYCFNG